MIRGVLSAFVLFSVLAETATAATVEGHAKDAAVVWLSGGAKPDPVQAEMRNRDRSFIPDLLVVPAGSSVRFPNDDPFDHSIYSDNGPNAFDVGYYGEGPGKVYQFKDAGIVDVRCHIHAYMHATIVVVDGPFVKTTNSYKFTGIAPGKYVLHVWNDAAGERTKNVIVAADTDDLTVDFP